MGDTIRVGIIGGGWPGAAHAKGFQLAGGFKISAIADLIPARRQKMMADFSIPRQYASAEELIADKEIDAVSLCVPNDLHQPLVCAALRAGKHVLCETPPATDAADARKMIRTRDHYQKVLMFAFQRRFGGHEQAAHQAIAKGYAGDVYHIRAAWTRTRGIPVGTGWYTDKSKSGGGAVMDLGVQMLDLAWYLFGQPAPVSVSAIAHSRFAQAGTQTGSHDVEDSAAALFRFEGGKTLEMTVAWAINQPPQQNGALCRVYGDKAAIEVYMPQGATLYRDFKPTGEARGTPLKPPKTTHHAAMMRHFRACILGNTTPDMPAENAIMLMRMIDAIYKSIETGKSVEIKVEKAD